jgi:hypothetical protein
MLAAGRKKADRCMHIEEQQFLPFLIKIKPQRPEKYAK